MIDPKDVGVDSFSVNSPDREYAMCYRDLKTGKYRLMNADEAIEFVQQAQKDHLDALSYSDERYEHAKAHHFDS
jgi:hypothetical protein